MTSNNQIIDINNDKYLIRKTSKKIVLHHLPSLDIVHKYYSQVNFFCINKLQIMLIFKNILTFLKPKCPPLRLIQYQQQYLDWQPIGGLSMSNMTILYDKSTIAFYYRNPKLQKSWQIDVIQQIQQVKSSHDQKFIALKVKQPQNTIFIWNMDNISKKPNQEIIMKQKIVKWIFYGENVLLILTESQFKIYFVNKESNMHYIQYYIGLPERYLSFVTMNEFNMTQKDIGRKSINTIAFLRSDNCSLDVVELYDIQKRQKTFKHSQFKRILLNNQKSQKIHLSNIISGEQYEQNILIIGQKQIKNGQNDPKCFVMKQNFLLKSITQYKQHLQTAADIQKQNIQSINDYILYEVKSKNMYKLCKFVSYDGDSNIKGSCDKIKLLKVYESSGVENAILTQKNILIVNKDKKLIVESYEEIQNQLGIQSNQINQKQPNLVDFSKYNPKLSYYIHQTKSAIFFVCGIRYFKYDFTKKQIVNIGFVLKNQRAKLFQVRISTSSLIYKINSQYVLIQYNSYSSQDKLTFKTIKSVQNQKIINLRKDKWAIMNMNEIIFGQGENQLATFSLQKMYKTLLQDNTYFEYDLFWTTHGGMILVIKNYLFFLQIIQNQNGHQIHLIKKGHSYLHRRFASSNKIDRIKVIDPRNLVVFTGNRIVKLHTKVQHYITENPYDLPDTLLNRQLKMREYFPPHHPNIINGMLENGWFIQIIKLMEKINTWSLQQKSIGQLYKLISIEDYYKWKQQNEIKQENLDQFNYQTVTVKSLQVRNEALDIQMLKKLSQRIVQNPQKIMLSQKYPLVLQNLLSAVIFYLQNSRAFDYFSQVAITRTRMQTNKNKNFTTMEIAFLKHSINKDQALQFLKDPNHKMEWPWIQKYSIALWYDQNIQKWKKWVEQIAMNLFRVQKDPFDCLFWYILTNKKSLLVTLFKASKFSSKQHDAMHTFLQRDFEDPKHKSAALKNAYALLDKKRYLHAMAFFLLSDKKQQCIRLAIDRLNDLNLAYLIQFLTPSSSKQPSSKQVNLVSKHLIQKGDIWAQHIGWVIQKKHIASYNVLLKQQHNLKWDYLPSLKVFHPSVIQFSQKIKQSIPFKRELESKMNKANQIQTVQTFDDFDFSSENKTYSYDQNESSSTIENKISTQPEVKQPQYYANYMQLFDLFSQQDQNGYKRQLIQKGMKYYMRFHYPCLALTFKPIDQCKYLKFDAQRAYQLQKYMLTGQISPSVVQIAEGLEDIIGILKNDINTNKEKQFVNHLKEFIAKFQLSLRKIKINELNPPSKHSIGQILHYTYYSQRIIIQYQMYAFQKPQLQKIFQTLYKSNNFGKIIAGVSLKIYKQMTKNLQGFKQGLFIQTDQQFWKLCRQRYDIMLQKKKQKNQKLMDCFQVSLNNHIKKIKQDDHFDFDIKMPKSSTISIILCHKIFDYLYKNQSNLKEKIHELKVRLDKIIKYWIQKQYIKQIEDQIFLLIKQGSQYRLKLNILSNEFKQKQLDQIEELLKLIYTSRQLKQLQEKKKYEQNKLQQLNNQNKSKSNQLEQKSAIQVFKNKSEVMKNFIVNKNAGKGLEIVVLFKKAAKKFQVLDNLINKDRTKDGLSLIHEDNPYISQINQIQNISNLLATKLFLPKLQQSIQNLIQSRNLFDQQSLIKKSQKYYTHLQDYYKPLQPLPPTAQISQNSSIQAHQSLPIFFVSNKNMIQIFRFDNMKNYNRIICNGIGQIVKMHSIGQRIYVLDKEGNLAAYLFDLKYNSSKVFFELKKQGIVDFTCMNASQIGFITSNSFQVYDTLLHPKRQCIFKIQMSTAPIAISHLSQNQIVVLRRTQVQIYDINKNQLTQSYNTQGRAKSLYAQKHKNQNNCGKIFVGRYDCRIKIIDIGNKTQKLIKVGNLQEQKDKIFIETIKSFGKSYFCLRSDGSIHCFNQ